MFHLSELIQLLGMVVTTVPFSINGSNVEASISINFDVAQLEEILSSFEAKKLESNDTLSDLERSDAEYKINLLRQTINFINEKVNGNDLQ